MNKSLTLYIASSMDGYIAGQEGELDWLDQVPPDPDGDYGYSDLMNDTDSILMGSKTYEKVISMGLEWPYPNHTTYVLSSRSALHVASPKTLIWNHSLMDLWKQVQEKHAKNCWLVGGGALIKSCLDENLLDKMILTQIPVLLGKGIPLFPESNSTSNWKLTEAKAFKTGLVNLTYIKSPR